MFESTWHIRIEGVPLCMVDYMIPPGSRPRDLTCGTQVLYPWWKLRTILRGVDVALRPGPCPQSEGFYGDTEWQRRSAQLMIWRAQRLIALATS